MFAVSYFKGFVFLRRKVRRVIKHVPSEHSSPRIMICHFQFHCIIKIMISCKKISRLVHIFTLHNSLQLMT